MKKNSFFLFLLLISLSANAVSLDEKIGQMLMLGVHEQVVTPRSFIVKEIQRYHLGGVVLYNQIIHKNKKQIKRYRSPQQLRQTTTALQHASQEPLFIAIDQEGGRVDRLPKKAGFHATLSPQKLGQLNNPAVTRAYARDMATTLRTYGINVNFFPTVDLNTYPDNPIIGKLGRSFSADPQTVITQASTFIQALHQQNVFCTLKHFPGHGSSRGDTHKGFVDVTNSWNEKELIPYKKLITQSPCEMVMIAHVMNRRLDKRYPASLSRRTIQNILRQQLHFQGLVVSDDLLMGAIRKQYSLRETVVQAINAGNDLLIFSGHTWQSSNELALKKTERPHRLIPHVIAIIKNAIAQGEIKPSTIDAAYARIMAFKKTLPAPRNV